MKKFIYFLAALMAVSVTSCKDDDTVFNNVEDLDRMPMTMFRKKHNTNVDESVDEYGSEVVKGTLNTIVLHWYGIKGAAGYEIRYAVGLQAGTEEVWGDPSRIVDRYIVGPDVLTDTLRHLRYNTDYRFQIRVLHPDGVEAHHSKWYGMGKGNENEDYMSILTDPRYKTPNVVTVSDIEKNSFNAYIDLNYKKDTYTSLQQEEIEKYFDRKTVNGKELFVANKLVITPHSVNPLAQVDHPEYAIDLDNLDDGKCVINVTGLNENSVYTVTLKNDDKIVYENGKEFDVDAFYNYSLPRTKGDPGPFIKIKHVVDPNDTIPGAAAYDACRIDTIIANYNSDITKAENQVFYLEGDKTYYICTNQDITKGFTLETWPKDVKEGKRARVLIGCMSTVEGVAQICFWNLGKNMTDDDIDAPLQIGNIIFRNLDFDAPLSRNYVMGNASGNYIFNTHKEGLGVIIESLQIINCTAQHFRRGFIRAQGSTQKVIKKLIVDGNVFYNMGAYVQTGGGYAWINGTGLNEETSIYTDVEFTNNTIYGSPLRAIIRDDGKEVDYNTPWNIKIENNTFINFGTCNNNLSFFDIKSVPGGTFLGFKNNLISLAFDPSDKRYANCVGFANEPSKLQGNGELTIDFKENYSVGALDKHLKEDGIFSNKSFATRIKSLDKYSPGLVSGDLNDLKVHVGTVALLSSELFTSPNFPHICNDVEPVEMNPASYDAPANIFNALKYRSDSKVTSHEIYTLNIGDQRWKAPDPKLYLPALAEEALNAALAEIEAAEEQQ